MPLLMLLALLPSLVKAVIYAYSYPFGSDPISFYYFVGYDTGFGGRKLMGTLCHWLWPNYITHRDLRTLVIAANALMVGLFVWLTAKAIRSRKSLPMGMLLAVYMLGPFSLTGWVDSRLSVGFMETYMMVLTLAWLLLYLRFRGRWHFYPATLLIAAAGTLLHHTFVCLFFPLMVVLFIYDSLEERGVNWHKALAYGSICLALLALFACIWRFSHMNVDMDTLYADLRLRAAPDAMEWNKEELRIRYYASLSENRAEAFSSPQRYPEFLLSLLLMAPLFAVLHYPWIKAFQDSRRWKYALMPAAITLLVLPSFFMMTDYSRLWTAWLFCLIAALLAMSALGDKPVADAMGHMLALARRRWWLAAMLAVYLTQLHIQGYDGLKEAIELRHFISNIIA